MTIMNLTAKQATEIQVAAYFDKPIYADGFSEMDMTPDRYTFGQPGWWYATVVIRDDGTVNFEELCKVPGSKRVPKMAIYRKLKQLGVKKFEAMMRESTSYKVVKRLPLGLFGIKILEDKREWCPAAKEWMHEMIISIP